MRSTLTQLCIVASSLTCAGHALADQPPADAAPIELPQSTPPVDRNAVAATVIGAPTPAQLPDIRTAPPQEAAPAAPSTAGPADAPAAPAAADASAPGEAVSPLSLQLNLDIGSAYFFRGIRQEDRGVVFQPAAKLTYSLWSKDDAKLDAFASVWNSIHSRKTLAEDKDAYPGHWYELDGSGGLTLTVGKLAITGAYLVLSSPSNAFGTVQELDFTVALDDSEWLGAFALKPYAMIGHEIGANGSDGKDTDPGTYLELGVAPGFSIDANGTPVGFTFPVTVGLSLSDYYQDAGNDDHTFGFVQFGGRVSFALPVDKRFGDWSMSAGVYGLLLGEHTREYNANERTQMLGTVGLQVNF